MMSVYSFVSMLLVYFLLIVNCSEKKETSSGKQADLILVSSLANEIKETSGLASLSDHLVTHNDAGNGNLLFVIDKESGRVQKRIEVLESTNTDWEDLAQNQEYLFIGDIGNNDGVRKDLKIYMVRKEKLADNEKVTVDGIIEFYYPEQQTFTKTKKHNFDAEAMIYFNGSIYLFSKNRGGHTCNVYKVKAQAGSHEAQHVTSSEIPARITGATIAPSGNKIVLTGYNKNENSILYIMENFEDDQFFSGANNLINLGSYDQIGQIEGVVFDREDRIFVTSEKTKEQPAMLYSLIF